MKYNLYVIEHKEGLVKKNDKLLLFGEYEANNYIYNNNLKEAVLRLADEDDIEGGIIYE